jgi:hypothetical protein
MSSARSPNLPRSSGPQTLSHTGAPIASTTQSRAVRCSNGATSRSRFWTLRTARPILIRDRSGSARNIKRSRGLTNGQRRPSAHIATLEGRHSISSSMPSSSYRSRM